MCNPTCAPVDKLRKVHLEITTECNSDCRMCVRRVWRNFGGHMALDTFQMLMEQLRAIPSVSVVSFGGFGEPTTHPHFFAFLQAVKEAGLRAELVTNGLLLSGEAAERILELELDSLIVSLDGVTADAAEALHGDSIALVQANLKALRQLRLHRRARQPEITIQFVATRQNIHQLPELVSRSWALGATGVLVTNLIPYSPELVDLILYRHSSTALRDFGALPWSPSVNLPRLDIGSEVIPVVEQLFAWGIRLRVCGADITGGRMNCPFANEGRVAIAPDGDASPCLPLLHSHSYYFQIQRREIVEYRVGNIRHTPLEQIWNDERYCRFRDKVRRFDFSPCINCGGCDLRKSNQRDCLGNEFPCCGACLWATGLIQCP